MNKQLIVLLIAVTVSVKIFGQTGNSKMPKAVAAMQVKYTCSVHLNKATNNSGKCSKCNMDLTKVATYLCSMHPEITYTKKGKCSKCGMDFTEAKAAVKTIKM